MPKFVSRMKALADMTDDKKKHRKKDLSMAKSLTAGAATEAASDTEAGNAPGVRVPKGTAAARELATRRARGKGRRAY